MLGGSLWLWWIKKQTVRPPFFYFLFFIFFLFFFYFFFRLEQINIVEKIITLTETNLAVMRQYLGERRQESGVKVNMKIWAKKTSFSYIFFKTNKLILKKKLKKKKNNNSKFLVRFQKSLFFF